MDKIYYQPNHLWKGQKAVKKVRELSGEKPKTVKQWLSRQAFWQVHLPAPKHIDRPHYQVTIPNEMHQFDLLYMPSDSLYGSKYKYILIYHLIFMDLSINTFYLELMLLEDLKFF